MPGKKSKKTDNKNTSALEKHVDAMMAVDPDTQGTPVLDGDLQDVNKSLEAKVEKLSENVAVSIKPDDTEPDITKPGADTLDSAVGPDISDNQLTDAMVDDIVRKEGDELLGRGDNGFSARSRQFAQKAKSGKNALARLLSAWWHSKPARYITLLVVLASLGTLLALPTSRYFVLNSAHVKTAATLNVVDGTTLLPLKNVTVEVGDQKAKTNQDGVVKLRDLQLGTQSLAVSQVGFATINKTVTLGLGSNPLGDFTLRAVGLQFRFKLIDYLSGKPVKNAEISSGDSNAQADKDGRLVLTVEQRASGAPTGSITAEGYRAEPVTLEPGQKQSRTIVMVPAAKEVFISKQSGKYDLYKMDIDGKNKEVLLAASGFEDANLSVVNQPSGEGVALVSRRDETKNQDGYPLQSLTLIRADKGTTLSLDHSERIQIVDWIDDKLIYVKIKAGTSAGNPGRYQLISYDYNTAARLQLAAANYFSDIVSMKGALYYASSNTYLGGVSQFVKINPDNTGKQVLLDKTEVWNIVRTSNDSLNLTASNGNYAYAIGDASAKKISDTPTEILDNRFYLDNADGKRVLWTDDRDGKGVLLITDSTTAKDKTLTTQTGLSYPIRWFSPRIVVYRVTTPAETADYAVSLDGGAPKKITDLTNAAGLGRWEYR